MGVVGPACPSRRSVADANTGSEQGQRGDGVGGGASPLGQTDRTIAAIASPTSKSPPARRAWTNATGAYHSGQTG
jgi:hypothetical protein